MRFGFTGWYTWWWALRDPFQFDHTARHTRNGVAWYARFAFVTLTRYAACSC
jgi:hypothetical protein